MTDDKAVFVDTNVLLAATVPARPYHSAALSVLSDWPDRGVPLVASGQVFREYLVVATRPPEVNGLGLSVEDALGNVVAFRLRMRLLPENQQSLERLQALVTTYHCTGKQIHDANVVASAMASGVRRLVTANAVHFSRFAAEMEVIDLLALADRRG